MTERDVVLRERAAFVRGLGMDEFSDRREALARKFYPLPKVTRTRVVQDVSPDGVRNEWKYENGTLWHKVAHGDGWHTAENNSGMYINTPRVKLLADLIAQPTETVDA